MQVSFDIYESLSSLFIYIGLFSTRRHFSIESRSLLYVSFDEYRSLVFVSLIDTGLFCMALLICIGLLCKSLCHVHRSLFKYQARQTFLERK